LNTANLLKSAAVLSGAALLASCGAVGDNEAAMAEWDEKCMAEVTSAGAPTEMATDFCDCTKDKIKEQELTTADMLDEEKMTAIGEQCAGEMIEAMSQE
ncbi:hypothetical protein N8940_01810, partial [Sphingomonadaceae bacterium]|nr:hypothetical protein [Sphingomonadaceae bacterium]